MNNLYIGAITIGEKASELFLAYRSNEDEDKHYLHF